MPTLPTPDSPSDLRVTIVVPCYNEEDGIEGTVKSLHEAFRGQPAFEILVVDDGSTDQTARSLAALHTLYPEVRVLKHERNLGYGAALKTGLARAKGSWIAITDADGTYPNHRLPELVQIAEAEDADMVVGARTASDARYSPLRTLPKIFLTAWASWLAKARIPDLNSGMRVMRRTAVMRFIKILPDTFSFTTTITLAMLTNALRVTYVPVGYSPRTGRSKIRPIRDTLRFVQLITRTGMYFAPLRVLTPLIVLLGGAAIASAYYDVVVLGNLTDKTVLLLMFCINTGVFALLADMIDKRSP
jgi:glycosyltransferase involved in cell wall biosynthesis